jgi:hypothetical protein
LSRPLEWAQSLDFARDPEPVERARLRPYGGGTCLCAAENESALHHGAARSRSIIVRAGSKSGLV